MKPKKFQTLYKLLEKTFEDYYHKINHFTLQPWKKLCLNYFKKETSIKIFHTSLSTSPLANFDSTKHQSKNTSTTNLSSKSSLTKNNFESALNSYLHMIQIVFHFITSKDQLISFVNRFSTSSTSNSNKQLLSNSKKTTK